MSDDFIKQAQEYASSHTKNTTKIIHATGALFILFSLQIFFSNIKIIMPNVFSTDLAWLLSLGLLSFYFKRHWQLTLTIAPIFYALNSAATLLTSSGPSKGSFELFFLLFIFGAIAQFIGHIHEKSNTSFSKGIKQMLLSPLFLMSEFFFYFSMMNSLYLSIYSISQEEIEKKNQERIDENKEEDSAPPVTDRRATKRRE